MTGRPLQSSKHSVGAPKLMTDVIKHVRVGNLLPISDTSWEAENIKVAMSVVENITTATLLAVKT
jgi:hypothetical protein